MTRQQLGQDQMREEEQAVEDEQATEEETTILHVVFQDMEFRKDDCIEARCGVLRLSLRKLIPRACEREGGA